MELSSLLPSWVRYARMGHNTILGRAEHLTGQLIVITTPAMEPDVQPAPHVSGGRRIFRGSPEKREIVEVGGPAYYGMALLTDEEGRTAMEAARHFEYDYSTDAEEVKLLDGPRGSSDPSDDHEPDEPTQDPEA